MKIQAFTNNILKHCCIVAVLLLLPVATVAQVNTDQVLRIGQNALYFDDYMLSIQYFNQAISSKPYLAQPYFLRAVAKLNLEDYRGAEADANKAIELNPFLTDAYEVRGVARQNTGRHRLAVEDYDHALKLLPRNRQLLFNKALALADLKEYGEAAAVFNEIVRYYPSFENAYLGRAHTLLAEGDTVAAKADIDKALSLNQNALNAYIMRADIAINSEGDYKAALDDIDHAIKLQPRAAGLYINRAFFRYKLDNYSGAMADYDYALTIEPYNSVALFNRGLLLLEVNANDLALDDFNRVLQLDPDDVRAYYNRAVVYSNKGNFKAAVDDISRVIAEYPELPGAFYMRGSFYKNLGQLAKAEADYKHGEKLAKALPTAAEAEEKLTQMAKADEKHPQNQEKKHNEDGNVDEKTDNHAVDAATARRFASLLTVDNNTDFRQEYNNTAIRGRVQDRNLNIETEPMMLLSFYSSPTELRRGTYYMREVDDLNATRSLRFVLVITSRVPQIDEGMAQKHFQSIEYYNSYLSTHTPRPIDYIGRALDFITVRDYQNAISDATKAIDLAPELALAYMVRAQARYGTYCLGQENSEGMARAALQRKLLDDIVADYERVIELSPASPIAWYNKANILFILEDFDGATRAFTKAIELKPEFGEAYFNRGYIALRDGRRSEGIADLSKAGELGIIPAYTLIKRISQ